MGKTHFRRFAGPCGPCSEIHVDVRSEEEKAKIDGKTFNNLRRADLQDPLPDDFQSRKELWDFLEDLVSIICYYIDFHMVG